MTGLITYMRTDSARISSEALASVRQLIGGAFGEAYVPQKPNVFNNAKTAQDAHEAIRPTDVKLTPEKVKAHLNKDMFALYDLIWRRFVASQMARERLHVRVAEITANGYAFVARGTKVIFDGFTKVYEAERREDERTYLPDMTKGEALGLKEIEDEPALHGPASPLHRGIPHQDPGGQRRGKALDLCGHREYHTGPGVRA